MPEHSTKKLKIIGQPLPKVDGPAKCTGITVFADDLTMPAMLHAKILRSTRPHALIRSIDTSGAQAMSGVEAVLTGSELPIPFGILPVTQDEHTLAPEKVRFVGDPVAAVAALDEETAEEAVRRIEVEYEDLKSIFSIQEALDTQEPCIQDYGQGPNIHKLVAFEFGDTDEALRGSDLVQEDLTFYEGNTHLPLEQHSALGHFQPDGRLTVWSSTQTPHYVHRALAKVLGLPASRIRVIACPNGGGFGGKSDPFSHEIAAAKLSIKTGRPVKITLTREEVFYCHRGRHPVLMRSRMGFTKQGKITGLQFQSLLDGGAFGSYGVASTFYTGALQTVTYHIPRYKFEGGRVFTNKPPCGPKRGHGTPQPRFALEIAIDKAAEGLKMDPAQLRLQNLVEPQSLTANWLRVRTIGLKACIEKVVEASGWKEKFRQLPRGRGVGLACSSYLTGAGLPIYWNSMPQSAVQLKLDRSGLVTAFCGSTDIGQGSDSVLAYVVAEELGIGPGQVQVISGDTSLTPVDLGSYSSRVTLMTGNAAIQAAQRARGFLDAAVAEKLEIPLQRVTAAEGRLFDAQDPQKGLDFAQAVEVAETKFGAIGTMGSYKPPRSPGRYKGAGVGPSPTYSYSACVIEVEADQETGIVVPIKVWMAHDLGRAVNPLLAIGQVEGSVYMGLGEALMEEQVFRRGVHKIPSMLDYKSPTSMDMCPVETFLIEDPDAEGPYGAKECGQGPLLPVPPAVVNAVYDALGVRIDEIPVTPERVLKALQAGQKGQAARFGPKGFPKVAYPEPLWVPPPWEGGDGRAQQRPGREREAALQTQGGHE